MAHLESTLGSMLPVGQSLPMTALDFASFDYHLFWTFKKHVNGQVLKINE